MSGSKSSFKKREKQARKDALIIGSSIEVRFANGKIGKFTIVESGKGSPPNGLISHDAPLTRAVLGAKEGEEVSYKVGEKEWKVVLIRRSKSS